MPGGPAGDDDRRRDGQRLECRAGVGGVDVGPQRADLLDRLFAAGAAAAGGDADVDVGAQALADDRARRGERVGRRKERGAHAAAVARAHLDQRAWLVAVKERAQVALNLGCLAGLRRRRAPWRFGVRSFDNSRSSHRWWTRQ